MRGKAMQSRDFALAAYPMEGPLPEFSLTRIEAALARIEAAAARPFGAALAGESNLAARHDRLRAAVTETLRDLDRLIGGK